MDGSLVAATRTLWYVYQPTATQELSIIVDQWERLPGRLPVGAFEVYSRDDPGQLVALPEQHRNDRSFVTFQADPSRRYWIGVGCATRGPCFPSFTITVTTQAP